MPIYEFYCEDCHIIFNFFSKTINTKKTPGCPKCDKKKLSKQMSSFAFTGRASESDGMDDLPFDEGKMEKAMQILAKEADSINDDDPRQTVNLMKKISDVTGRELEKGMTEALERIENGEDPEQVEREMGDILESEDPFNFSDKRKAGTSKKPAPQKDDTLYDL